jgi:hypothetical protein
VGSRSKHITPATPAPRRAQRPVPCTHIFYTADSLLACSLLLTRITQPAEAGLMNEDLAALKPSAPEHMLQPAPALRPLPCRSSLYRAASSRPNLTAGRPSRMRMSSAGRTTRPAAGSPHPPTTSASQPSCRSRPATTVVRLPRRFRTVTRPAPGCRTARHCQSRTASADSRASGRPSMSERADGSVPTACASACATKPAHK